MTPGIRTTEFWVTVATSIIALLAMVFHWPTADTNELTKIVSDAVVTVFALIGQVLALLSYVSSRTALKSQAMDQTSDQP